MRFRTWLNYIINSIVMFVNLNSDISVKLKKRLDKFMKGLNQYLKKADGYF